MSYNIKGEASVETGLGLPQHTTVSRLAYTPPAEGYAVYDTDLDQVFFWDGAAWNVLAVGNYANTNLTADATRIHTFGAFDFVQNHDNSSWEVGNSVTPTDYASLQVVSNSILADSKSNDYWCDFKVGEPYVTLRSKDAGAEVFPRNLQAVQLDVFFEPGVGPHINLHHYNSPNTPIWDLQIEGNAGANGDVLTSSGPNLPPSWGAPPNTNYAESTLTADADRTHTWNAFDLQQNFTTGILSNQFTNGADSQFIDARSTRYFRNVDDGTGDMELSHTSTEFLVEAVTGSSILEFGMTVDGAGNPHFVLDNKAVGVGVWDLQINGDAGTIGQVLTSKGAGFSPEWDDLPPPAGSVGARDEGTLLTATADSFNFVGAGVTATTVGNDVTVTIPGAAGSADNYAENNLTADANRQHNFTTFNLRETFTTGTRSVTAPQIRLESGDADGYAQAIVLTNAGKSTWGLSSDDYINTVVSYLTGQADLTEIYQENAISDSLSLKLGVDGVNQLYFDLTEPIGFPSNWEFRINGNPGTAGQVLQSQGPAAPPVWGLGGGNYASQDLTAAANRTHTWNAFSLTENYVNGTNTNDMVADASSFSVNTIDAGTESSDFDITPSQITAKTRILDLQTDPVSGFGPWLKIQNASGPIPPATPAYTYLYTLLGELHVVDSAGNDTLLSPHDGGEDWVFYSENIKTGKKVKIDVERFFKEKFPEYVTEG